MGNNFSVCIPLMKGNDGDLIGIASTTSIDKDEERMSDRALKMMVSDIKSLGINLFGNHEHNWENTLGVIKDADLVDNQVQVKITLDDATTNPKVPMMLNKMKRGIKLGLSVGGAVTEEKMEYVRELGKKIKVIDGVKLYEISVVGLPSNSDSYMSLPMAIGKSAKRGVQDLNSETLLEFDEEAEEEQEKKDKKTKKSLNISKCPVCLADKENTKCQICNF